MFGKFHPCVRLFNAERLYYLLIQSIGPVQDDRNHLRGWLEEKGLLDGATMDIIFGEADILLRIWADTDRLNDLLDRVNSEGRHLYRIKALLLVNDMDVIYQRRLEHPLQRDPGEPFAQWLDRVRATDAATLPPFSWDALEQWLSRLRSAKTKGACFPDNKLRWEGSNSENSRLVRFWIFCEGYTEPDWKFFEQLRDYVLHGNPPRHYGNPPSSRPEEIEEAKFEELHLPYKENLPEEGRSQLGDPLGGGTSLYTYEEVQRDLRSTGVPFADKAPFLAGNTSFTNLSKGVILKGQFDLAAPGHDPPGLAGESHEVRYQKLMERLSAFVHELRNRLGIRTVTYLCASHIFAERGFKPTEFADPKTRTPKVLYSLLKTHASSSYYMEHKPIPSHLSGERRDVLEAREARIQLFVDTAVLHCYPAIRRYHKKWWETVSHAREVFGWVANGNNDALKAALTVGYADIEDRLRVQLRRLGRENAWLDMVEEKIKKNLRQMKSFFKGELSNEKRESDDKDKSAKKGKSTEEILNIIHSKFRDAVPPEKGITYAGVEGILGLLVNEHPEKARHEDRASDREGPLTERQCWSLARLADAVKCARDDRNKLAHGMVGDLFFDTILNDGAPVAIWQSFVINYLRLYLIFPLADEALSELISYKEKEAVPPSRQALTDSAVGPVILSSVRQQLYFFDWPGNRSHTRNLLLHTLDLLRKEYDITIIAPQSSTKGKPETDYLVSWLRQRNIGIVADLDEQKSGGWAVSMGTPDFFAENLLTRLKGQGLKIAWGHGTLNFVEGERGALCAGQFDAIFYVSAMQQKIMEQLYQETTDTRVPRGVVVGSFIDPATLPFKSRTSFASGAQITVGRLSKPDPDRFPDDLVEFFTGLKLQNPRFRIMAWDPKLEAKWPRPRDLDRWQVLTTSREPVLDFLESLDLFVFDVSSRYRECYGRTVVEAMLTGAIPILPADPRHHLRNLVRHGESGYLCETRGDFSQYARMLEADPILRGKISRQTAQHARDEHCDPIKHLAAWREVFYG